MSDLIDAAADAEERFRAEALRALRRPATALHAVVHCADCGARIPLARRRAVPGVTTCLQCQDMRERVRG